MTNCLLKEITLGWESSSLQIPSNIWEIRDGRKIKCRQDQTYVGLWSCVCVFVCKYEYACTYVRMYVHMYVCMYVCTRVYVYMYLAYTVYAYVVLVVVVVLVVE